LPSAHKQSATRQAATVLEARAGRVGQLAEQRARPRVMAEQGFALGQQIGRVVAAVRQPRRQSLEQARRRLIVTVAKGLVPAVQERHRVAGCAAARRRGSGRQRRQQ
jgi:hypothetical protein